MSQTKSESKKLLTFLLLGDGAVGKSTLVKTMQFKKFSDSFDDQPYPIDKFANFDAQTDIRFIDMPCSDGYDEIRNKIYQMVHPEVDGVIFCFSLTNPTSLKNLCEKWITEAIQFYPETPRFLIGTKAQEKSKVYNQAIESTIKNFGIKFYLECTNRFDSILNVFANIHKYFTIPKEVKKVSKFLHLIKNRDVKKVPLSCDLIHRVAMTSQDKIEVQSHSQPKDFISTLKPKTTLNFLFLGDGVVGKTTLINTMKNKTFTDSLSAPLEFEETIDLDNDFAIRCLDMPGQSEYEKLRYDTYKNYHVDVILLCFSFTQPTSLSNVEQQWLVDARKKYPHAPIYLIATKAQESEKKVTKEEIDHVMKKTGKCKLYECHNDFESIQKMFLSIYKRLISLKDVTHVAKMLFLVKKYLPVQLPNEMLKNVVECADDTIDGPGKELSCKFNGPK